MASKSPLLDPESAKLLKSGDLDQATKRVQQATGMSPEAARQVVLDLRSTKPWVAIKAMAKLATIASNEGRPAAPSGNVGMGKPGDFSHSPIEEILNRPKGLSPGEVPRGLDSTIKWYALFAIGMVSVLAALYLR